MENSQLDCLFCWGLDLKLLTSALAVSCCGFDYGTRPVVQCVSVCTRHSTTCMSMLETRLKEDIAYHDVGTYDKLLLPISVLYQLHLQAVTSNSVNARAVLTMR